MNAPIRAGVVPITPIFHPVFSVAYRRLLDILTSYRERGACRNLLITGESGQGKTTLCEAFAAAHPPRSELERDVVPVLHISVSAGASVRDLLYALLLAVGDPFPEKGSVVARTERLIQYARACGLELLIIDEAQHLYDRGRTYTHYLVGDWLKGLIDAICVPVVLVGLPRTVSLLQVNEQLRRRFTEHLTLDIGNDPTDTPAVCCYRMFQSLCEIAKISIDPRPLVWSDLGERLLYASDGRIGYMQLLAGGAVDWARREGARIITLRTLSAAFSERVWPGAAGNTNPFDEGFAMRRLDRVGEPFMPDGAAALRNRGRT